MTTWIAFVIAFFFAVNIGASGTSAAMSSPYGGGAIKNRWVAQMIVAVFSFIGAFFGGESVAETIASGLIDTTAMGGATLYHGVEPGAIDGLTSGMAPALVLVILVSACITLFAANMLAIPLSTSEVTVGSVVGVGIALGGVYVKQVAGIALAWMLLPMVAFVLTTWGAKRLIPRLKPTKIKRRWLGLFLVVSGCYQSLAAGMNNAANAVGPLIGAGMIDGENALLLGATGLALGAIVLGGPVLQTSATKLTRFNLAEAGWVSFVGATLVFGASILGIPVPLTQTMTVGIIGISWAHRDREALNRTVISRIIRVWCLSPIASLLLSLGGATLVLNPGGAWLDLGSSIASISGALLLLFLQSDRPVLGNRQILR